MSTDYQCPPVKREKASVRFYLRVITICVSRLWFWYCTWNLLTSSMTKASNKTLVLLSSPNSLNRLVQKYQLLIQNSIQSASWTLLPTSWRNLSCYIGQTQDLGTAAVATSVGKKGTRRSTHLTESNPFVYICWQRWLKWGGVLALTAAWYSQHSSSYFWLFCVCKKKFKII